MKLEGKNLVVVGAVGAAALLFLFRKQVAQVGTIAIDAAKKQIFIAVIPSEAEQYADAILQVASEQNVDPFLIVALGERETAWGTGSGYYPKGSPAGTGDGGHGHGLLQIDDRTWGDWLATHNWGDPHTNITQGVLILKSGLAYFAGKGLTGSDQLRAAIAAYNHGPGNVWKNIQTGRDVDYGTEGNNYSSWVATKLASLTGAFTSAVAEADSAVATMLPDTAEGSAS